MQSTLIMIKAALILTACLALSRGALPGPGHLLPTPKLILESLFPSSELPASIFDTRIVASPLLYRTPTMSLIIIAASNGEVAALSTETGARVWQLEVPTPKDQEAELVATPVIIGDKLVVIYQCIHRGKRVSHRLAVIDLTEKRFDRNFPILTFSAEKTGKDGISKIRFNPPTAFSHGALKHAPVAGSELGTVYASFGNAGDTQPFHGWLFAVDLDAWQHRGSAHAVRQAFLTTPEAECPVTIESGTQEMICGGGIWTPAGPQIFSTENSYELLVPTGNGQMDLGRGDYANALLRLSPGMDFDPECDAALCDRFDPAHPQEACMASCKNLFIPRPITGNAPLHPAGGECDDKSFWECLAWMDYDLGANAPVKLELSHGQSVLVQPGKDGGVYLIDARHLGKLYDRMQVAEPCGTVADPCAIPWAGMIVTQPIQTTIDTTPVVVIPTFVPDKTHPAGLVALKVIVSNGLPKFEEFWRFPDPASDLSKRSFRTHPSLPALSFDTDGTPVIWIVDIGIQGRLYAINVRNGELLTQTDLKGTGRPLAAPVINGDRIYLTSMLPESNQAIVEAFTIVKQ